MATLHSISASLLSGLLEPDTNFTDVRVNVTIMLLIPHFRLSGSHLYLNSYNNMTTLMPLSCLLIHEL